MNFFVSRFFTLIITMCILAIATSTRVIAMSSVGKLVITSNNQDFVQIGAGDLKSIFTGNVSIVYNNDISLIGNKVIVTQQGKNNYLVAYGNPVIVNSNKRHIHLTSNQVTFDAVSGLITAIDALADYNGNKLSGALIVYNVKNNSISAKGSENKQVKTIINNLLGTK